ncbi:MAG: TonB-dependent receptor [Pyrinomonadaceae bacterium]
MTNKKLARVSTILLTLAFVLITGQSLFAQGTRGTIRGTVTDPSQAVVPNATVELIDVAKNVTIRTTTTNESGEYQFVEIEPSTYNVLIRATNFAELRLPDVTVEPNRNVVLDAAVSLTTGTTTVEVTAGAEQVDRESPTLGTTVENRRVEGLPLNGRNVLDLALLQPGVAPTGGTLSGLGIRVNGSRGTENNVTIDGASNNEVAVGGLIGGITRPDAVQEFRLLTSNFEAEFGRNTGSIINVVTKSGTNEFHGNARFFYRGTELSAANFFDNALARSSTTDNRQPFDRKDYGFNIGGPVFLPHFGEGGPVFDRGKTFFFVDYERRYQKLGGSITLSNLPSAAERNGDFSALLARGTILYDPRTATAANPGGNPFPGNIIPVDRRSSIAGFYLPFIPAANAAGQALASNNAITRVQYITIRGDHNFNQNNSLNFTYNESESDAASDVAFGGTSIPGFGSTNQSERKNYVGRFTSVITSKLVNTFLTSYSINDQPGVAPLNKSTPRQIGFTSDFVANPQFAGPPFIQFGDRGFTLGNTIQGPQNRFSENIQFQDALSYVIGNHRLKGGFDYVKYKQGQDFLFINQGFLFYSARGDEGSNTIGDDFACFLLADCGPTFVQFGSNGRRDFRQNARAGFIQDNWRVTDKLSLSLGLRYEYNSPLTDRENRVSYYRGVTGATSPQLAAGTLTVAGNRIVAAGTPPTGLVYVGDPDPVLGGTVTRGGIKLDKNNFAPRLGFAYSLNGGNGFFGKLLGENQTVIRGGLGQYYGAIIGDTALQQLSAPGFAATDANVEYPGGNTANPFGPDLFPLYRYLGGPEVIMPLANPFIPGRSVTVGSRLSNTAQPIDPFIETPVVTQYNLTFERSFLRDFVLGVSYVGNFGRKLYVQENINPALGTLIPASTRFEGGTVPTASTANASSRRRNDDFLNALNLLTTKGKSRYDALEVNFQKRFSDDGLSFQLAYTRSRSLNDADTQRGAIDILDQEAGYARSSDDYPDRFVGSFIYEIPFFKNTNGFVKRLVDGFSIGGIYTYQSGSLFSVGNPYDINGVGGGIISFIDINPNVAFTLQNPHEGSTRRAFNADAFIAADCRVLTTSATGVVSPVAGQNFDRCINPDGTKGRRGTSRRNQFRLNNPTNNWDFIVSKKTRLWSESSNLELRFEAFNAFNRTQFVGINTNFTTSNNGTATTNPAFGTFTSAAQARSIQLGARISF